MSEPAHAHPPTPPEPQTPLWLPAVGAALFAVVGIGWAVCPGAPPPSTDATADTGAPAPTVTATAVAAAPPRPTPPPAQPAASGSVTRPHRPLFPVGAGSAAPGARPQRPAAPHP